MKKFFFVITSLILVVVLFSGCGEQFDSNNENREVSIRWEEVNLHEDHTTNSDIIVKLHQGDQVILTGYTFTYVGGNGRPDDYWTKVITEDGKTGWIVTTSIQ